MTFCTRVGTVAPCWLSLVTWTSIWRSRRATSTSINACRSSFLDRLPKWRSRWRRMYNIWRERNQDSLELNQPEVKFVGSRFHVQILATVVDRRQVFSLLNRTPPPMLTNPGTILYFDTTQTALDITEPINDRYKRSENSSQVWYYYLHLDISETRSTLSAAFITKH